MAKITIEDLKELSVEEKILLVEDLWNSIASQPESVPLTQAQRMELDRRLEINRRAPLRGASWNEVRGRIESPSGS